MSDLLSDVDATIMIVKKKKRSVRYQDISYLQPAKVYVIIQPIPLFLNKKRQNKNNLFYMKGLPRRIQYMYLFIISNFLF